MSWLLFLDESGHDHRTMPYEVHGGFAIHAAKLWAFISAVKTMELSTFGAHLHQYGSELKGARLLDKDRFAWERQGPRMDDASRCRHALNFLNNGKQGRTPRRDEFTAYGQACISVAEGIIQLLAHHDAKVFAVVIPHLARPKTVPEDFLRKDLVFLLERYFYFLDSRQEMGLLVMDGSEKKADRKLVRRIERYFTQTMPGRQRTQWIVPVPMFVESDMAYGVQVADLCIYCLNWGWRLPEQDMSQPTRLEIEPFVWLLEKAVWHGSGCRDGRDFATHGVIYIPDPYERR
ncbi:MAG: DUF3800 domain-containing protein [Planctomycetota bacterium]|jgi:hypothetical protein|nr:DUF3800 domain-containing protein [Planctomycetota bacterium]